MGSRYDAKVLRGITLDQFIQAYGGPEVVGDEAPGPWQGPTDATIAQIDTASGSNVIVVGPPMQTVDGINTLFADKLGAEALFGTVWDSVSTYELIVDGDEVDRFMSRAPSLDDDGEFDVEETGERLPGEPVGDDLDEAYIQTVFMARCGIDPGNLRLYQTTWYSFGPPAEPEQPGPDLQTEPASEAVASAPEGLWSRVKRLLGG